MTLENFSIVYESRPKAAVLWMMIGMIGVMIGNTYILSFAGISACHAGHISLSTLPRLLAVSAHVAIPYPPSPCAFVRPIITTQLGFESIRDKMKPIDYLKMCFAVPMVKNQYPPVPTPLLQVLLRCGHGTTNIARASHGRQ